MARIVRTEEFVSLTGPGGERLVGFQIAANLKVICMYETDPESAPPPLTMGIPTQVWWMLGTTAFGVFVITLVYLFFAARLH